MQNLEDLERLVQAVEEARADIAPTYEEYMKTAFAVAYEFGERGRSYFHRLVQFSPKYRHADADKIYNQALRKSNGRVTMGTVYHYAAQMGIYLKPMVHPPVDFESEKGTKGTKGTVPFTPTHAHVYNNVEEADIPAVPRETEVDPVEEDEEISEEELYSTSTPLHPLPCFPHYTWPVLMQNIMDKGAQNQWQRDVLFLTSCVAMGICLSPTVGFLYGGKTIHPCLQLFVVALPATGKGVMGYLRNLVAPFQNEVRSEYHRLLKEYEQKMYEISCMGKEKTKAELPEKPLNKMFVIPADNTGTGILQNLIDSGGRGLILEPEADTLTNAVNSDFGKWGDVLRKGFDESGIAYNRRGNGGEYKEAQRLLLGVALSGTPGQFIEQTKSSETGGFSRQLFYYMQPVMKWMNQIGKNDIDLNVYFNNLGEQWKKMVEQLIKLGTFTLKLTDGQTEDFNNSFNQLFNQCALTNGAEMAASVKRLAINLIRIMEVVATLRMLEKMGDSDWTRATSLPNASPASDTRKENQQDGVISHWELSMEEEDFQAILKMMQPLYEHILHMLTLLPTVTIKRRDCSEKDRLFTSLPYEFTLEQLLQKAEEMGIKHNTAKVWLKRMVKSGSIIRVGRGRYQMHI